MIVSLIITWIFWFIVVIIDVIFHPEEWYLFLIPPIIISIVILLLAIYISDGLCIILTVGLHLLLIFDLLLSYLKK